MSALLVRYLPRMTRGCHIRNVGSEARDPRVSLALLGRLEPSPSPFSTMSTPSPTYEIKQVTTPEEIAQCLAVRVQGASPQDRA